MFCASMFDNICELMFFFLTLYGTIAIEVMKMTVSSLNKRQKQILDYIKENLRAKGYPPSVREIGEVVGLSSSFITVHSYLT
ncbi:LexA family protein [Sporomusa ovata]